MLNISKSEFIEKYNDCNSLSELKEILNCSRWYIQDKVKKYNLPKKEKNKRISLTDEQKNIIIGALLGDGGIFKCEGCKNSYFTYTSSEKEHVEYIYNFLKDFMTDRYKDGPKKIKSFDKRTKKYHENYSIRTYNNITFEEIREKWYKDKKIIPDIKLNQTICKIWYLGDGGILQSKTSSSYIKLSTDGFDPIYVNNIINKLSKFNARIQYKNGDKSQSVILIPRNKIKSFLNYIGDCPIDCYKHKWNYIRCKSDKVEKEGISNIKIYENEIINYYNNGFKIKYLSNKYNCDASLIRYYLKKNKIKIKPEKNKYRIIYDNGEVIERYNLKKFCLENKINHTQIYKYIKNGKKYKDFYIEKIN